MPKIAVVGKGGVRKNDSCQSVGLYLRRKLKPADRSGCGPGANLALASGSRVKSPHTSSQLSTMEE